MTMLIKEHTSRIAALSCSECDKCYPVNQLNTYATCERCEKNPLLCSYALKGLTSADIDTTDSTMWRYLPFLPVMEKRNVISLGEGWTPILKLDRLQHELGMALLLLKDESQNPTGSFKARGMSAAISKALECGVTQCITATAGNAGGALSAYCAKAGLKCVVVMPRHTPLVFQQECKFYGAQVVLVEGLISDCAKMVATINRDGEYFDVSTFTEPYRLEGKKTLGYEIAEQLRWQLPDVILYPTGGGTGFLGIWKAFHEMIAMGWIGDTLPRMIAVQAENCNPLARTWAGLQPDARSYRGAATIANGLAVPNPFAEKLMLRVLTESDGTVESVSEEEIVTAVKTIASREGLLLAPEGAALYAALGKLLHTGKILRSDRVLLLNTGSGYKYLENLK